MARISPERLAQLGIGIQLLALIRTLGEYFRLRYVQGPALTLQAVAPFISGAMLAAVCTAAAVLCYFAGWHRVTVGVAAATVVLLIAYRFVAFG